MLTGVTQAFISHGHHPFICDSWCSREDAHYLIGVLVPAKAPHHPLLSSTGYRPTRLPCLHCLPETTNFRLEKSDTNLTPPHPPHFDLRFQAANFWRTSSLTLR